MSQLLSRSRITLVLIGISVILVYTFLPLSLPLGMTFRSITPKFLRYSTKESNPTSDEVILPKETSKWIVVTSINQPTDQIKKLSQIPGWILLVVADLKTPKNWTLPNSIILTTDVQKNLGYKILQILPWNAYTRKMIGYLYAIQHGAQFIYDTDDDNAPNNPESFEKSFVFEPTMRGLILNDREKVTANPYIHFGQPSVWPRGLPLEDIGQDYNNTYTACQMATPLIQQGLVNGDPDVDAIFRLTRKKIKSSLKIQFDGSAPPLMIPKSVLTPFNSQNTLFHYNAFWSMMLPVSVTFRVTDIWRGYWAQPLLWAIGGHLGFFSAETTQLRNAHVYLRDFGEEDKMYQQGGKLTRFLRDWKCSAEGQGECMMELTQAMLDGNFWQRSEIKLTRAWIDDLVSIGYKMPDMRTRNTLCLDGKPQGFAMFTGVTQKSESQLRQRNLRSSLREFCGFATPKLAEWFTPMEFSSTLLVVTFNHHHFENIWLLDLIYRPHFPNMIFCGYLDSMNVLYDLESTLEFINVKETGYSFVNANVSKGYFAYECALRVIDMNYRGITGYLFMSDDIMLNFWRNEGLNPKEVWWPKSWFRKPINVFNPPSKSSWFIWNEPLIGLNVTKAALTEIASSDQKIVQQFVAKREEYGLSKTHAGHAITDIFYFPVSKQNTFYEVGWILRRHDVFLEIATPIIMNGLSSPGNTVFLDGHAWSPTPLEFWKPYYNFVHPFKLSKVILANDSSLTSKYCDRYIKIVLAAGTLRKPVVGKELTV